MTVEFQPVPSALRRVVLVGVFPNRLGSRVRSDTLDLGVWTGSSVLPTSSDQGVGEESPDSCLTKKKVCTCQTEHPVGARPGEVRHLRRSTLRVREALKRRVAMDVKFQYRGRMRVPVEFPCSGRS